ncbi:UDP-N-acetylmuramate--L-alanine ligase [Flavobacterium crassostreae]|uniref:UDP-N-acetylmuramate--L-alanine ligase n=1 Tax=Flavobacterium crassostreae TaxID=1763534 RepID=A0A1B9DXW6_9FLAO|nr:UDP-N-acetylmuramate--L-alanine ligase [Flavobacterium crassostreae]OCB74529.1 UDP-N-acetylmuramate--L-alanine ligase [Flavobacterium crassostreae]
MNLDTIHHVYFIGIGGIGMSNLARYFKNLGKQVAGYDKTPTALTDALVQSGISIHFEDNIALIPVNFTAETTLVVTTPAVPKAHTEWNYFLQNHYYVQKRAEVLGWITKDSFCFAVAGTHGKTTTSGILGHILYESGADVTAFIGGVVENYNSNLIGNGTKITVVEADEFDRSFLHLHPDIACVTSMDADHLDIYGTSDAIEASFVAFASKIASKDNLFITNDLPLKGRTVAVNQIADYKAFNIRIEEGIYLFDVQTPTEILKDFRFGLPGKHNLMNAMMAIAMAKTFGTPTEAIAKALQSFKGIKRRFSYQYKSKNRVYIDDYAHHPTEIDAVHQAVRELYPDKKVLAIFQPHLFSRTRDFAEDFARSLSNFDQVALLDIYPARELPIEGITSAWLLDKMTNEDKKIILKNEVVPTILASDAAVVVTIGAGDIGEIVSIIKEALHEND